MRHKISCAVHDPTPGRCDCGAKTDLQLAQEEITRLRKELNNALSAVHWRDLELDRLRQRVTELERIVKQDADQLMMRDRIIRERGERMKVLFKIAAWVEGYDGRFDAWFDPETGEPL